QDLCEYGGENGAFVVEDVVVRIYVKEGNDDKFVVIVIGAVKDTYIMKSIQGLYIQYE
ncbi:864_t:CDS:1, partial [Funneliformis mosseae]